MKNWPWFICTVVVVLLDQASKYWVFNHLTPYQSEALLPMLNFTLAFNTGASFSFLSGTGSWHCWLFTGFGTVMSVILTVWIIRLPRTACLELSGLSLILAGALGNLTDRVRLGHVIDFIDVYYGHYHWPVFNLADSAICVGAFLLLVDMFVQAKKERHCVKDCR